MIQMDPACKISDRQEDSDRDQKCSVHMKKIKDKKQKKEFACLREDTDICITYPCNLQIAEMKFLG